MSIYSSARKLRIALFIDNPILKGWQAEVIKNLGEYKHVEFVLIVTNAETESTAGKIKRRWKQVPWAVINVIERNVSNWIFANNSRYFTSNVKLEDCLKPAIPTLPVLPITSNSGFVQRFEQADIETIRSYRPDVVLRFGFRILRGDILNVAKHGVLSMHHGDNNWNRGGPPGFWEVYHRIPTTGAIVQVLTEELDNGIVIKRGHYRTFALSWNENRRRLYAKSLWLLVDSLQELANTGKFSVCGNRGIGLYDSPLFTAPNIFQCTIAIARLSARSLQALSRLILRNDRWYLLLARSGINGANIRQFHKIKPPNHSSFYADPFIVEGNSGSVHLFFEEYLYRERRGIISHLELPKNTLTAGGVTKKEATTIISENHHLSYPFLFRYGNSLYMIPESGQSRTVDLWECTDFPYKWSKIHHILRGVDAADTTLLEFGNRWWLFTNIDRSGLGDHCSELFIFYADSPLTSQWHPHPLNPVITDCRQARMGGGFIKQFSNGHEKLFRIAQKSGEIYGTGIIICEVFQLDPNQYEEKVVDSIEPRWDVNVRRTHHLATHEKWIVLDACNSSRFM